MTDDSESRTEPAVATRVDAPSAKRTDANGRAFAGSQMHLQTWVNARTAAISEAVLSALGIEHSNAQVKWLSPVERSKFRELRDTAFLRELGLSYFAKALRDFWPKGGPVWDGLAMIERQGVSKDAIVLIEAKSYPDEVLGSGCKATAKSRERIETALDATASWLGVNRPASWVGTLYQSANRIAHVYFLRELLGLEAYMANVCFVGDPRRATTEEEWKVAKDEFRRQLEIDAVATPWLVDVLLPAADRTELLLHTEGNAVARPD